MYRYAYPILALALLLTLASGLGTVSLDLLEPLGDLNATRYEFFNISVQACCLSDDCGTLNVSLDPDLPELLINEHDEGSPDYNEVVATRDGVDVTGYTLEFNEDCNGIDATWELSSWDCPILNRGDVCGRYETYDSLPNDPSNSGASIEIVLKDDEGTVIDTFGKGCSVEGSYYVTEVDSGTDGDYYRSVDDDTDTSADWSYQSGATTTYNALNAGQTGDFASGKGLISTTAGATPFYSNSSNPYQISLNQGVCRNISWEVNATGDLASVSEFFIYANLTADVTISDETAHWNVTIVADSTAPEINWSWSDANSTVFVGRTYVCIEANEMLDGCIFNFDDDEYNNDSRGTSLCYNVTGLSNTNYTVYAECNDTSGNDASTAHSWLNVSIPDTTAPSLSWNWTDAESIILVNSTRLCVNASERLDSCSFDFNGTTYTNNSRGTNLCYSLSGLGNGNYSAGATCNDTSGNDASVGSSWVYINYTPFNLSLEVVKAANLSSCYYGDGINWTITLNNTGGNDYNISMSDSNGESFSLNLSSGGNWTGSYTTTAGCSSIENVLDLDILYNGTSYSHSTSASVSVTHCGDGICNCAEDCSSCSADCGSCSGGGSDDECDDDGDCDDDEVCCDGDCEECCDDRDCSGGDVCCSNDCEECCSDSDCDDDNECTDDDCFHHECEYEFNSRSCDDGDDCTDGDRCNRGDCIGTFICECQGDSECDDGEECTIDSCVSYYCEYDDSGCVEEEPVIEVSGGERVGKKAVIEISGVRENSTAVVTSPTGENFTVEVISSYSSFEPSSAGIWTVSYTSSDGQRVSSTINVSELKVDREEIAPEILEELEEGEIVVNSDWDHTYIIIVLVILGLVIVFAVRVVPREASIAKRK